MRGSLLIFCGIPGSGKTTIASIVAKDLPKAVHIQTDAIRSMVANPTHGRIESQFVYKSLTVVAREALKAGYDAILDGTFLREEFRGEPIRRLAGLYASKLVVHVACDPRVAYERNLMRRDRVPKKSFLRLYSQFQRPRDALTVDTELTTPELASQAILLQLGHARGPSPVE